MMKRLALALLLGCLLLVAGASALDGYDYYQTIEYAACDQDIYQQDIVIHRTTGTAYNETAGGLETWHIFVGEHCREDYGDVRFTDSTGAELAYYLWPDYDSSSARFAVRLEGADAAGVLQVWYGNPSATTTSDGDTTYYFFDNFEGTSLDASKWSATGSVTVSGGVCRVQCTNALARHNGIVGKEAFGQGYTAEFRSKGDNLDGNCWAAWALDPTVDALRVVRGSGGTAYHSVKASAESYLYFISLDTNYHVFSISRESTNKVIFGYDAGHSYALTDAAKIPTTDLPLSCTNWRLGVNTWIDYALVRAYSATPPAALAFSGEQSTATPPLTAFTATPTAGLAPLTVQFTDASTGHPTSWLWSFGDGGTSTAQNPQHTYTVPGTYTVTLTATNEYGSTPATKLDYITVYGPITAQFSANITGGTAPLTVQFTDLSTGGPTSWLWTFGDGGTSTEQNPQHTYTTAGAHTVTLTASHPYDSDTETKTSYITVAVLQPFPGLTNIPRDLTGNGLYTDINGNNRLDYNDLTIFFQNLAWAKTAQPIACFDFNGNGWLDYNDVITLFSTIMEEHT